jgi:anti-anti-sigma factor
MESDPAISVRRAGRASVLTIEGVLDPYALEPLEEKIDGVLHSDDPYLVIDLAGVEHLPSPVAGVFLTKHQEAADRGGGIAYCRLTPPVARAFDLLGLAAQSRVFPTEEEAVRSVAPAETPPS